MQPILSSSFSLSSRQVQRWLREMVELGFRSPHKEKKREIEEGGRGEESE